MYADVLGNLHKKMDPNASQTRVVGVRSTKHEDLLIGFEEFFKKTFENEMSCFVGDIVQTVDMFNIYGEDRNTEDSRSGFPYSGRRSK